MATTYENPNPANRSITTDAELRSFYDKMKHTVVGVHVSEPPTPEQLASGCGSGITGTGVVFDEHGNIMTCWHTFERLSDQALDNIEIRYWNASERVKARVMFKAPDFDFAILRPSDAVKNSRPFASLASPSSIKYGIQTLTIGHPGLLAYSFGVGHVAHPNRLLADIVDYLDERDRVEFKGIDPTMSLIQLNNTHGDHGQSGGPVFDNTGSIIGLSVYSYSGFKFASHVKDLRWLAKVAKRKATVFWGAEVLPGQTLLCHAGSCTVLHITQASLGVTNTAEDVSLNITKKSKKFPLTTLSRDRFPQVQLDLVLDKDFELSHSSRKSSVFVFGNKYKQAVPQCFKGKRRSGDSDEDEEVSEDDEEVAKEGAGQAYPKSVSSEADGTVLFNFQRKKGAQSFFNHVIGRKQRISKQTSSKSAYHEEVDLPSEGESSKWAYHEEDDLSI